MYRVCRHIMPNGDRCRAAALSATYFCYFHTRLHRKPDGHTSKFEESVAIPILEDRCAIQVALSNVLNALGSSKLDARKAGVFLYGSRLPRRMSSVIPSFSVSAQLSPSLPAKMARIWPLKNTSARKRTTATLVPMSTRARLGPIRRRRGGGRRRRKVGPTRPVNPTSAASPPPKQDFFRAPRKPKSRRHRARPQCPGSPHPDPSNRALSPESAPQAL